MTQQDDKNYPKRKRNMQVNITGGDFAHLAIIVRLVRPLIKMVMSMFVAMAYMADRETVAEFAQLYG